MTTAFERRAKKAARAHGRGGKNETKVGLIAPTVSRETKRPKRETKGRVGETADVDDETLEAELVKAGSVPRSSGDGSEGYRVPTRVKLTTDVDVDAGLWRGVELEVVEYFPPTGKVAVMPPDGDQSRILPENAFVQIASAEAGSIPAKQRLVPLYGGTLHTPIDHDESELAEDAAATARPGQKPLRVRLLRDVKLNPPHPDLGEQIAAGSEWRVYRAAANGIGVQIMDAGGRLFTALTADEYEVIEWTAAASQQAHAKSGSTEQVTEPERRRRQGDPVESSSQGNVQRSTARGTTDLPREAAAAAPQLEPPAAGTAGATKGKPAVRGKGRATAAEASADLAAIAELPVIRIRLGHLRRHPKNRQPTKPAVARLAESLRADGQLEPIVVRGWDDLTVGDDQGFGPGGYQILSGETRCLAAAANDAPDLLARVVPECDDERALRLLALFNSQRTDLNPIEKARLVEQLGQSGMSRDEAAKVVGLETGAAASNLVRLLELPEVWQQRVASGELPQTFARLMTSYATVPAVLGELDRSWKEAKNPKSKRSWQSTDWNNRDEVEQLIDNAVDEFTRPVDGKSKFRYPSDVVGGYGEYARLFKLTDDVRAKLGVVKIKIDGADREVATNLKAFDELQVPLVEAKVAAKKKREAAAFGRSSSPAKKSGAQAAAEKRARAEKFRKRVESWRSNWLAKVCRPLLKIDSPFVPRLLLSLLVADDYQANEAIQEGVRNAVGKAAGKKLSYSADIESLWPLTTAVKKPIDVLYQAIVDVLNVEFDLSEHSTSTLPGPVIDEICAALDVDVASEWRKLWSGTKRERLEEFLLLHNEDELQLLAKEWGFELRGSNKGERVKSVLASALVPALPKSIKPLGATGKRKRGRR